MQRAFEQGQGSAGELNALDALATLLLAPNPSAGWQVSGAGMHPAGQAHHRRLASGSPVIRSARSIQMKKPEKVGGRMGKKKKTGTKSTGFDQFYQKRMMQDEQNAAEWVVVLNNTDLGGETGATKAVEAGVTPRGQDYLWTMGRGDPIGTEYEDLAMQRSVFAFDGSCRICQFPMFNGKVKKEENGLYSVDCSLCGTKWSLEDGEGIEQGDVIDWLPAKNPVQWAQKQLHKEKDQKEFKQGILPVRISKGGMVRLRLPDGTLVKGKTFPAI